MEFLNSNNRRLKYSYTRYSLVILLGYLVCSEADAGPTITVGERVAAGQQVTVEEIKHSGWTDLLQKYVDEEGQVDYKGWKSSAADLRLLDKYLRHLSSAKFVDDGNRESKLAYWINAYNAVTVKGILREYPTSSIRNHTAKFFGYNIWHDLHLLVNEDSISLDHIEHKILRKMNEPRIHFAIVCASIGCPRLLNEAYEAEKLDQQLSTNAKFFFANSNNLRVDSNQKIIYLTKILEWFGTDFGSNQEKQLKSIAPYLTESAREAIDNDNLRVRYLDYDWNLNER